MANRMTKKQYDQLKNESYTVIRFKDGKRLGTVGGCSMYRAFAEMVATTRQSLDIKVLVIPENDLIDPTTGRKDLCIEWNESYYQKFSGKSYFDSRKDFEDAF